MVWRGALVASGTKATAARWKTWVIFRGLERGGDGRFVAHIAGGRPSMSWVGGGDHVPAAVFKPGAQMLAGESAGSGDKGAFTHEMALRISALTRLRSASTII